MFKLICTFAISIMFGCATCQQPAKPVTTTTEVKEAPILKEVSFEERLFSAIVKIRTTYTWCEDNEENTVDGFGFLASDNGLVFTTDVSVFANTRESGICNIDMTATLQDGRTSKVEGANIVKASMANLLYFVFDTDFSTPMLTTEVIFKPLFTGNKIFTINKEGKIIRGTVGKIQPLQDGFVFDSSLTEAVPGFPIFNEDAEVIGIVVLSQKEANSEDTVTLMISTTYLFLKEFGAIEGE